MVCFISLKALHCVLIQGSLPPSIIGHKKKISQYTLVIKLKDLQSLLEEDTKQSDYFVVNNPAAAGTLSYRAIFHGWCTDVPSDVLPEPQKDDKPHVNKTPELFPNSPLQCAMHVFPELLTLAPFPTLLEKLVRQNVMSHLHLQLNVLFPHIILQPHKQIT